MSIKKSISFTFGAQVTNTLIGFVTSIIVTRILGAGGRGEQAIFTNSNAFAVLFFGFSINSTITYFINSGKAKAEELLTTIIFFIVGSTFLVYGTLVLLEHFRLLHLALPNRMQSVRYQLIFTSIYFVLLLNGVLAAYLVAYKKFKAVSIYGVSTQLLPLIVYALLYYKLIPYDHAHPFETVLLITLITTFLSAIIIIGIFLYILPIRPSGKLIRGELIKQFVLFSAMAYIGNIATFFSYKLDFWVVDEYWGKAQLGVYSLAAQLSQLLWILPSSIASVLYSYASKSTREEAIRYTIRLKQIALYATFVFAIMGLILSYFLIPVLYGKEFSGAFNLMVIFMSGVVPFSIASILASLNAARGNFRISFVISLINFLISCGMYFLLIPKYGPVGGAIASALIYLSSSIMAELWFCKEYNVPLFNLFKPEKEVFSLSKLIKYFKK